jgi:hypothetical protein
MRRTHRRRARATNHDGAHPTLVQTAAPFTWLGMVPAISILETPLSSGPPGITVPLGLGIRRLAFRALNAVELALAVALTAVMLADKAGVSGHVVPGALIMLWAVLVSQVVVLRRRLDRRARRILARQTPPCSHLHRHCCIKRSTHRRWSTYSFRSHAAGLRMSGLLRFSKVPEGPASPLWYMARTPFALMQQCRLGCYL